MSAASKYFSPLQLKGILKAGDLLIPGQGLKFPKFSDTYLIYEVDRVADYMVLADRKDFQILMALFGLLPIFVLRLLLEMAEQSTGSGKFQNVPILGSLLRQIRMGVKGVVFSLYYSDAALSGEIYEGIGWDTRCELPEPRPETQGEKAFRLARSGSKLLRKLSPKERLTFLSRLKNIVVLRQESIIDEIVKATGKTRTDALTSEIFGVLDHLQYLEKFAVKVLADRKVHTPWVLMGKSSKVYFEPLGTLLVISPWNYPFYQALVPITSGLICGNTVVYKPSEHTPLQHLVERLLSEAGMPRNWVQVVYGDGALGEELIGQRPDKIFFTGSTRTGRKIMARAATDLIPVELELGGKDPMIVFQDADLRRAAHGALWGACTNAGQSCTSVERIFVQETIFEAFKAELLRCAENLIATGVESQLGRITVPAQVETISDHLREALSLGAVQLTGKSWDGKSSVIPPIVLENVTTEMKVFREETFGPLLPIVSFKSEDEVIARANDSEFGLSASVWSKNLVRAQRVARKIATGNVSINNVMVSEGNHALPFGGTKNSGFGRYKGEFGLYSFSNLKSVISEGNSGKIEAHWYPYDQSKYSLFRKLVLAVYGRGASFIDFASTGLQLESYAAAQAKRTKKSQS